MFLCYRGTYHFPHSCRNCLVCLILLFSWSTMKFYNCPHANGYTIINWPWCFNKTPFSFSIWTKEWISFPYFLVNGCFFLYYYCHTFLGLCCAISRRAHFLGWGLFRCWCTVAWWRSWNSILYELKFSRILYPKYHPQRIFWFLVRQLSWGIQKIWCI